MRDIIFGLMYFHLLCNSSLLTDLLLHKSHTSHQCVGSLYSLAHLVHVNGLIPCIVFRLKFLRARNRLAQCTSVWVVFFFFFFTACGRPHHSLSFGYVSASDLINCSQRADMEGQGRNNGHDYLGL